MTRKEIDKYIDEAIEKELWKVTEQDNAANSFHRVCEVQLENACKKEAEEHRQLAEWLRELKQLRDQTRWIPVSERLPETNDDVIVYDGVDMYVAWYSREGMRHGWNSSDNNFDIYTPIIAWMPLPETRQKVRKRMKTYKCDRCGCYFDYEKTLYFGAIKVDADFCPECVRSFEKWLKMENTESEDNA